MKYFAHAGEEHAEAAEQSAGLLNALTHQPVWAALLIIAFILFGIYVLLEKLGVKPLNRVISLVPLLILIAILFMEHNPVVSTVVLSLGFVASFVLAFSMISGNTGGQAKNKTNGNKDEAA